MTRKIKFTITTVRRQMTMRSKPTVIFCFACGRETESMTAAESKRFLEIEDQRLDRFIKLGIIHTVETASGNLRLCKNSLLK